MLLQALNDYAKRNNLVDSIELTNRTIHLLLNLKADGSISPGAAWFALDAPDPKDKKGEKRTLGAIREMPRFPGENNGGKAHFLADGPVVSVLGDRSQDRHVSPRRPQASERPGPNPSCTSCGSSQRRLTTRRDSPDPEERFSSFPRSNHLADRSKAARRPAVSRSASLPSGRRRHVGVSARSAWVRASSRSKAKPSVFRDGGSARFSCPDSPLHDYWSIGLSAARCFTKANGRGRRGPRGASAW